MSSCEKCERQPSRIDGPCPVYNMSDGRHFTDYRPRCELNSAELANNSGVLNSYEYRMYLQHNAEKLMKQNEEFSEENNKCVPCFDFNEAGTMLPEQNKTQCNANTCNTTLNDSAGLGTGRNYNVPTNNPTLSNQPGVSTETFLNFY